MPESIKGRKIIIMDEPENIFKMPDALLTRLGRRYRALARISGVKLAGGVTLLLRDGWIITFDQFIADQRTAALMEYRRKREAIPQIDALPM